jgi:hypothetical protein
MYSERPSSTHHDLADHPVQMPLGILLALPDYTTADAAAPIFNLPNAFATLIGGFGWERATKIIDPKIWAPGWSTDALSRFATSPFGYRPTLLEGLPASRLAVREFPGVGGLSDLDRSDYPEYEIVHFIGVVDWHDGERAIQLSEQPLLWMQQEHLVAALKAARTRLVILQVPPRCQDVAERIATGIAEAGGPAVLVVAATLEHPISAYLTNVYAAIIHNTDLNIATKPDESLIGATPTPAITLHYGVGGPALLRLDAWLASLQAQGKEATNHFQSTIARETQVIDVVRSRARQYLHPIQVTAFEIGLASAAERLRALRANVSVTSAELQQKLNWARESGGVEPLSRIAETVPELAASSVQVSQILGEIESMVERVSPARVLNANFASTAGKLLPPTEALMVGEPYDLLVDIGPRWNQALSIVSGIAQFPDQALPPGRSGHQITVLLISDDFTPRLVKGALWLPRHGRSHPWSDDGPSEESGPIRLRVTVRAEAAGRQAGEARARLFLYYENTLLQSALVSASVFALESRPYALLQRQASEETPERRNEVAVDYRATGTFTGIEELFAERAVHLGLQDPKATHPVTVNITLNHDGRGSHRIIVQGDTTLPLAFTAYDPAAATRALHDARQTLADCFGQRDASWELVKDAQGNLSPGLNENNGKPRSQFCYDLALLAEAGQTLYHRMLLAVEPEGSDMTAAAWSQGLRQLLQPSRVIQVARIESTPLQYAFPWSIVYDVPLSSIRSRWQFCKVITEEWSKEGLRTAPVTTGCPHANESWHQEDILCPYGFWGLRHVIEQPLVPVRVSDDVQALRNPVKHIPLRQYINLAVGWTRDPKLNLARLDAHVDRLIKLPGMRLAQPPPNPAQDIDDLRKVLESPNLVYFICHCENDLARKEPFLSVGLPDGDAVRKVYVNTVMEWATKGLPAWRQATPLIFINGCHTGDLEPGELLNFIGAFGFAGAAGVIGTEVSVPLRLATEVAERLCERLVRDIPLGQAVQEVRWDLVNKGNLLGLCYTAYALADLQFQHGAVA